MIPPPLRRRRLILAAPGLALPALAGPARAAGPLRPDAGVALRGPGGAAGALVWVHPHYTEGEPPEAPPFLARMTGGDGAAPGWDLWRHDRRRPGPDPLLPGAEALAAGTRALRAEGYRQVVLVGESRGAFIILVALRFPQLADAALALAPAAHGRRPERRPEALAAFREAMAAAAPDAVRRAGLVLFQDDPYDPDTAARAEAFATAMRRLGIAALLLDRPAEPTGHGGTSDPEFDPRYGACLTGFLAGTAPASACARPA